MSAQACKAHNVKPMLSWPRAPPHRGRLITEMPGSNEAGKWPQQGPGRQRSFWRRERSPRYPISLPGDEYDERSIPQGRVESSEWKLVDPPATLWSSHREIHSALGTRTCWKQPSHVSPCRERIKDNILGRKAIAEGGSFWPGK